MVHTPEMNKYQNRRNLKLFKSKSFRLETVNIYEKRKNVSQREIKEMISNVQSIRID